MVLKPFTVLRRRLVGEVPVKRGGFPAAQIKFFEWRVELHLQPWIVVFKHLLLCLQEEQQLLLVSDLLGVHALFLLVGVHFNGYERVTFFEIIIASDVLAVLVTQQTLKGPDIVRVHTLNVDGIC